MTRPGLPAPGRLLPSVDRRFDEIEGDLVHDEALAARIEGRDHGPDRGQVELAGRAAADDVDLGFAGPIDIGDRAEQASAGTADLGPDDLVPEHLARGERRLAVEGDLEIRLPQALRSGLIANLAEAQAPAGPVGDRARGRDREGRVAALDAKDAADPESVLGVIRQDLDPDEAAKAVDAPDSTDDEAGRLAQRNRLR